MSSDDESHMAVDLSDDEEVQYEEDDQGEDDVGGEDEPGSEESEESDDENNSLVMPQRKVRSVAPVWLEAGTKILASGQVIGAKCNFCEKTYKHNSANTSNLTTHVIKIHKKNHPDVVKRLQQAIDIKKFKKKLKELLVKKLLKNQPKLMNWVARKGALDPVKKDLLVKSVLEWAIATNQPFSVTESHHFRKVIFKAAWMY